MSILLVTYIRKNPFELSNTRTPIHPYTKSFGLMTSLTSLKPKTYTTLGPLAKYFIYLYSKKLEMSTLLVTYIRKNTFVLSNTRTPIYPYTKSFGLMTSLTSLKSKIYTSLGPLAKYFINLYSKKLEMSIFLLLI